jgi:16S rRNA (guanine527-N7)-methyltransferase
MTDDDHARLEDVTGPVSRETFDNLKVFEVEFRRWSARINLAAPSTLPELWTRHVLDSAQILRLAPQATSWLDIGSGGGFPGAVVAILLKGAAGAHVSLVESNRKKAAFLQTVLGRLGAPATVHALRIEDAPARIRQPQVITARALAALPDLLRLTAPWTSRGARALFHKGRDYRAELAISAHDWTFDLIEHRSTIDAESVILDLSGVEAIDRSRGRQT